MRTVDVEKLIDEDHSARSLWEVVGRLDLSLYYAQIAAVEGRAGREHTDPQLMISLWLYAYSRVPHFSRSLREVGFSLTPYQPSTCAPPNFLLLPTGTGD